MQEALLSADVVCLEGPVGAGKTKLIEAAARWATSTKVGLAKGAIASVRTNALLDQYQRSLGPGWLYLRRKDWWRCGERDGEWGCEQRKAEIGAHCKRGTQGAESGCPYVRSLAAARAKGVKLVANWQLQVAHKLKPDLVCVDEAHGLPDFLAELKSKVLWRHQWRWPRGFESVEGVAAWLETESRRSNGLHAALQPFADALSGATPGVTLRWGEGEFRGRPEEFLRAQPIDVRDAGGSSPLWRSDAKLLLASATLSEIDVEAMGLNGRRIAWVRMPSEIDPERRPLYWWPAVDMRHERRAPGELAAAVAHCLSLYPGQRGIVHATYSVARELRASLSGYGPEMTRLRFHDGAHDKQAAIDRFVEAGGDADRVLVVSGQYEGLDLPGDLATFQILTQAPRASLGDPSIRALAERSPLAYEWRTVRDLAQASGRVCRGPTDRGDSILIDSSAEREIDSPLIPAWLKPAIIKLPRET